MLRSTVSLFALLILFAPAPAPAAIPAEHFARHAEFEDIKISPDGRYLAATVPQGDSTPLVIIDRADMKSGSVLTRGKNEHVYWFEWANDDRIIYKYETKRGGLDFPVSYGEIFGADADGRNHGSIFGYQGAEKTGATRRRSNTTEYAWAIVIDLLPDEPRNILIASVPWAGADQPIATLMKLDVHRGITQKTGRLPLRDVSVLVDADARAHMVAGYTPDFEWAVNRRPDGKGDWAEVPALSDIQFIPIGFSDSREEIYGFGRDDGSVLGLFRFVPANGSVEPLITNLPYDVSRALVAPGSNDLLGVYSSAERFDYYFIDNDHVLIPVYSSLLKAFPDHRVFITSATADFKELIVHVENDRNPGEYFIFDREKMNARYLLSARSWLDPEQLASVEPVSFEARDGMTIHGYVTFPSNVANREQLPMVVLPHGGPYGAYDSWRFDWEAQFLASRGYAVLQPNFRGSGGYGRNFEESGYREWGGKMQDDVTDATQWAIDEGIADANRICIYGASYGGYAALMGAAREPTLYRCAIGSAGVYDLELLFKKGDVKDWIPGSAYLKTVVSDDPDFLKERSPVTHADKIKAPVLLVHGGRDVRAPIAHAKAMREALKKAGNEPQWLVFRNEAHGYYDIDNRVQLLEALEAFLARHIGG